MWPFSSAFAASSSCSRCSVSFGHRSRCYGVCSGGLRLQVGDLLAHRAVLRVTADAGAANQRKRVLPRREERRELGTPAQRENPRNGSTLVELCVPLAGRVYFAPGRSPHTRTASWTRSRWVMFGLIVMVPSSPERALAAIVRTPRFRRANPRLRGGQPNRRAPAAYRRRSRRAAVSRP